MVDTHLASYILGHCFLDCTKSLVCFQPQSIKPFAAHALAMNESCCSVSRFMRTNRLEVHCVESEEDIRADETVTPSYQLVVGS
jgi:hypothetical protein